MDIMMKELLPVQNVIINVQHVREHQPIVKLVQEVTGMVQQHVAVAWDCMMMVQVLIVKLVIILVKLVPMGQFVSHVM